MKKASARAKNHFDQENTMFLELRARGAYSLHHSYSPNMPQKTHFASSLNPHIVGVIFFLTKYPWTCGQCGNADTGLILARHHPSELCMSELGVLLNMF